MNENGCSDAAVVLRFLLRAQTEHAIGESSPADAAQNEQSPGNGKPPTEVGMTTDQNS